MRDILPRMAFFYIFISVFSNTSKFGPYLLRYSLSTSVEELGGQLLSGAHNCLVLSLFMPLEPL